MFLQFIILIRQCLLLFFQLTDLVVELDLIQLIIVNGFKQTSSQDKKSDQIGTDVLGHFFWPIVFILFTFSVEFRWSYRNFNPSKLLLHNLNSLDGLAWSILPASCIKEEISQSALRISSLINVFIFSRELGRESTGDEMVETWGSETFGVVYLVLPISSLMTRFLNRINLI